ncbi:MAG: hypothetical protein ACI4MP_01820 [Candidatus Ventricola sp.]
MHKGRAAALMAALLLLGAQACALEADGAPAAFGGSGEDALYEAVACGDGLLAVGTTASSDYDLSMRTRSGETGWALRLNADGSVRFSFCTGRAGMTRMTAPAAFEDGSCSLVLVDGTAQRGEWIVLDERGRSVSRVAIDGAAALCPQGERIVQMLPVDGPEGVQLAALVAHADGETMCCARLAQDGSAAAGKPFAVSGPGVACAGREGLLAYAAVQDGGLSLAFVNGQGTAQQGFGEGLTPGVRVQAVHDAQMGGDGSVAVCGETADGGGFLLRASREGERLFLLETGAPLTRLTATDTGYAALEDGRILFTDEDGSGVAWAAAPENTLDLAPSPGGAAALSHLDTRGRRQAAFAHVAQPELEPQQRAHGAYPGALTAGDGVLLCSAEDALGVRVRHMSADGEEIFSVRTPIHTAADALEWRCAAKLDDGSILLGGRYLYGTGEDARQQGVTALLGGDGVLRRMETLEDAAAVCAIELTPDGEILLHTSAQDGSTEDAVQLYDR